MKRKIRKIKKYEIRLAVLALIVIVMNFVIPKTGSLVLLDELCGVDCGDQSDNSGLAGK